MSFKFIRQWKEVPTDGSTGQPTVCFEYEASFWEGPLEVGQQGRRYTQRVIDRVKYDDDGLFAGFANTAPNVSYYSALKKALKV